MPPSNRPPVYCSRRVTRWGEEHHVVISKGQANYEALSERSGVFHLLIVKCDCIAEEVGASVGDSIVQYR